MVSCGLDGEAEAYRYTSSACIRMIYSDFNLFMQAANVFSKQLESRLAAYVK